MALVSSPHYDAAYEAARSETTSKSTAGGDEVVGQEEVDSVMNLHSILKRSSVDPATVSSISIDESGKMRRVLVVSTPDRAIAISLFHPLPSVRRSLTVTDRIVSEMRTFTLLRSLRSIHARDRLRRTIRHI